MMPRWYVARTATNMERRAEKHAKRFDIETFVPEIVQRATVNGQKVERSALMFPGYAFVRFAELAQWARAKRNGYIFAYLLGYSDDRLTSIADGIVDEIRSRLINGVVPATEHVPQFSVGQKVRVVRGAYAELFGTVERTAGDRVSVLLTFFNRSQPVMLDDGLVIAA